MEEYTKKTMEHFQRPKNVGEIKNADGVGRVGNIKCGDIMHIYIKVAQRSSQNKNLIDGPRKEEYIQDIKFKTLGCAAAIASSSMTTELAKGKTLDEAINISRDDINEALGKLPAPKYHCSILAAEGIKRAIENYRDNLKSKKIK